MRNFKYESYSKPEEDHFQLRIIWLLSIVSRPYSREAARMADKRPLNLAQLTTECWETGSSGKLL
ncbi:hypothetical protein [Lactiplantibacillus pentosus]|uniref:hypothetical protein n=1 Tax=Lactiplantibacillus pentosus TaxID=1589 RepID=UPI0035D0D2BD